MAVSERLYDCTITYHLITGQALIEDYKNDLPKEVWIAVKDKYEDCESILEFEQDGINVLLPKSNVSYITMKVCS